MFWLDRKDWKLCAYSAETMPRMPPFECTEPIGISEREIAAALAIFGVPVLVLIVGCAVWWALRGFKPREN
jgi:hypothetical protein